MSLKTVLKSKIHRATVSSVDLNYPGSIRIDSLLMRAARISEYEQVHVLNVTNGQRFVTYAITDPGHMSDTPHPIRILGAAAHLAKPNDIIIIITYEQIDDSERARPIAVFLDEGKTTFPNKIKSVDPLTKTAIDLELPL